MMSAAMNAQDADNYPSLTVVTVVRNGLETLPRTCQSVWAQQYPGLRYHLIDGGSTDGTWQWVKEQEGRFDYTISEPDKGISDAFNKGIASAQTAWVALLNADDWYEEGALTALFRAARAYPEADILYADMQYWKGDNRDFVFFPDHHLLEREMTLNHPAVIVKKAVYDELGGFLVDYKYAMDYEWLLRAYKAGKHFVHIPVLLTHMQLDGASDRHWQRAYQETARAKILHGIPASTARAYLRRQVLRTYISRSLQRMGLMSIIRWYRSRYSLMKKQG